MAVRGNRVLHRRGDAVIFLEEPDCEYDSGRYRVGHPHVCLPITTPLLGQLDRFGYLWISRIGRNGDSRVLGDRALIFLEWHRLSFNAIAIDAAPNPAQHARACNNGNAQPPL